MLTRVPAIGLILVFTLAPVPGPAFAQPQVSVTRKDIPGIRNYSRVDATVGCGGATETSAFPALKAEGFASIVNLRLAGEPGVDIPAARTAAAAAGLKYLHIPFDAASPSPAAVQQFLDAVTKPDHQPVYIHCGSANRVGAVWLIKRVIVDGWTTDRAVAEAEAIGLRSPALKTFALDYAGRRR